MGVQFATPTMSCTAELLSRYKSVQVTTSSPGQLVVMLFDGVFRFMREARDAHARGDLARFVESVTRVHSIVDFLRSSPNLGASSEICDKLEGTYAFCMRRLTAACIERSPDPFDDVERILQPLREAWLTGASVPRPSGPVNSDENAAP